MNNEKSKFTSHAYTNDILGIDCWVGAIPFRERFRRLFELSVNKDKTEVEMFSLGWEEGGEYGWNRPGRPRGLRQIRAVQTFYLNRQDLSFFRSIFSLKLVQTTCY